MGLLFLIHGDIRIYEMLMEGNLMEYLESVFFYFGRGKNSAEKVIENDCNLVEGAAVAAVVGLEDVEEDVGVTFASSRRR